MWKIKLVYFLISISPGFFDPYLPVLFSSCKMASSTLGILYCVRTIVSIIFNFIITAYADRASKHRLVAKVCIYSTILCSLLFYLATISAPSFSDNQFALGILFGVPFILVAIARSPLLALENNAIMNHLSALGKREEFGRIRLYGALGFGIANGAMGFFIGKFDVKYISLIFACAMLINAAFANSLYGITKKEKEEDKEKKYCNSKNSESVPGFFDSLKLMFRENGFISFAFVLVVMGYTHTVFSEFVTLFINDDPDTTPTIFAWTGLAAMAGELPFFFFSNVLLRKFGPAAVILAAQGGTVLRLVGYGMLHGNALIAPQLLHGITFSLMWSSSVVYVDSLAPPSLSATAQSVLSILYTGVAAFVSTPVNGYLYQVGGKMLVVSSSVVAVVLAIVVWVATAKFKIEDGEKKEKKGKKMEKVKEK